jgi:hypothetical protein
MIWGAGFLIHSSALVLLGKKVYGKARGRWSGIGGALNAGEVPARGAVRELLEEIYGIYDNEPLISAVQSSVSCAFLSRRTGYALYELNFAQLAEISRLVNEAGVETHHYGTRVPTTVPELAAKYRPEKGSEFSDLCLFPKATLGTCAGIDRQVLADLCIVN